MKPVTRFDRSILWIAVVAASFGFSAASSSVAFAGVLESPLLPSAQPASQTDGMLQSLAFDVSREMPKTGTERCGARHPRGAEWRGGRGHRFERQLERLKTSLRLNPQQTALWDTAQKATFPAAEAREKMHEQRKAGIKSRHDELVAALADPAFDPRKLAAGMDRYRADAEARVAVARQQRRDAWFAVYDSLDTAQKGQVREFLRARVEMMHAMHGRDRASYNGAEMRRGMHDPRGGDFRHRDNRDPGCGPDGTSSGSPKRV